MRHFGTIAAVLVVIIFTVLLLVVSMHCGAASNGCWLSI